MTEDEFSEIVNLATGFWSGREWPVGTLEIWWREMRDWDYRATHEAIRVLARESEWLPSFKLLCEGYRIERGKRRHLHAVRDYRPPTEEERELAARWNRIIMSMLSGAFPRPGDPPAPDTDLRRAVRRHYRYEERGVVVMSAQNMLADAEEALAAQAFNREEPDEPDAVR